MKRMYEDNKGIVASGAPQHHFGLRNDSAGAPSQLLGSGNANIPNTNHTTNIQHIGAKTPLTAQSALAQYYAAAIQQQQRQQQPFGACCFGGSFRSPVLHSGESSNASSSASSPTGGMFGSIFGSVGKRPVSPDASTMTTTMIGAESAQKQRQRQKQKQRQQQQQLSASQAAPSAATTSVDNAPRRKSKAKQASSSSQLSPKPTTAAAATAASASVTSASAASDASSTLTSTQPLTEDFLAKELNDLSIQERQQVYEDVHGVSQIRNETPEFLQKCLDSMQREIARLLTSTASSSGITKEDRQIYDKAMFYCPKLLRNTKLRLMFIRCEDYDGAAAAVRYMRYWSFQYDIVDGDWDAILKPCGMTQEDLLRMEGKTGDDAKDSFLHKGFLHVLPQPDQSGRLVVTFFNKRCIYEDWKDAARTCVYIIMQALEQNVNAQIHGMIGIAYECVKEKFYALPFDMDLLSASAKFYSSLPIKYRAFHFCYDDPKMKAGLSLVQLAVGKSGRLRFRAHFGTDTVCRYKLMTFGIPTNVLPVHASTSTINMDSYHHFLDSCRQRQQQQLQEEGDSNVKMAATDTSKTSASANTNKATTATAKDEEIPADYPTSRDILHGRGRSYQEHPGNRQLNAIIADNWETYESANRSERAAVFNRIVAVLRESGIRFLEKRKKKIAGSMQSEWVVVDDSKARAKVSHTFRNKPIMSRYHSSKEEQERDGDTAVVKQGGR